MANDPTIRTFTAAAIEKYHRGELSDREMHDLEKAALDDPFLAEALEGYQTAGVNVAADLADLQSRLAARVDDRKVVPLAAGRSSFPWFRAAAMIVLVAGAGLLIYQLGFRQSKQPTNIAQAPSAPEASKAKDSDMAADFKASDTTRAFTSRKLPLASSQEELIATNDNALHDGATITIDSVTVSSNWSANAATAPPAKKPVEERKVANDDIALQKPLLKTEQDQFYYNDKAQQRYKSKSDSVNQGLVLNSTTRSQRNARANNTNGFIGMTDNESYRNNANVTNVFRGRVTDASNNVLPFANVTNIADNVGTYADAKGNFTLISTDSVLNVQVRSIGFENYNAQLRNNVTSNQVTMEEDKSLAEVVISNKRPNSDRSRSNTLTLEEPEPIDGWVNYDTYLANNLVMPENFRTRQSSGGEVKLSFEVDRNGKPVNITVDQSLCESCDKEAIRLVKEGPKWKRKARKKRTTVTISF